MIKLFVTDLDGCISYPYRTPNWEAIQEIRELNIASRTNPEIPPLTICTGRPHPYAEAVAQWLDVRLPFVFESAGLYHWDGNRVETGLANLEEALEPIREMKVWLGREIVPRFPSANVEFSKLMDAGIVTPDKEAIKTIIPIVREKLASDFPQLEMHTTDVSVNILMPGNNKYQGMKLIARSQNVTFDEIAYIGDTGGDIPALEVVKMAFAPSNATRGVKDVSINLEQNTTEAVLEAYRRIIAHNESLTESSKISGSVVS